MSDVAGELKNAVMSPAKAFDFCLLVGTEDFGEIFEVTKRWVGDIREVAPADADAFVFMTDNGKVPRAWVLNTLLDACKRGKHIFEFRPVEQDFVRRSQAWLEHPRRT